MSVLAAAERLRDAVDRFEPDGKVAFAYNPLRYAWAPHRAFVERFGVGRRRVLLVGMNPGPWGMGQTGVPFGDPEMVREWLRIEGHVERPAREHPKRPVLGFASRRREPSGSRVWGWARQRFGEPEKFFADYYVLNYCPLLFFGDEGTNLTPPDLPRAQTQALYEACDAHVVDVARKMRPELLVGIGGFARDRLRDIAERHRLDARVGMILHPSPASPLANKGWAEQAERQLREMGAL